MTDEIRCKVSCEEDRTRSGPGRIVGRILTYGERATDRAELFERGALTWPADGVVLNRQHERGAPIMRVLPTLVGDELRIDQILPDTVAGRDAATEIRSGLLRGLSVSFQAARQVFASGVRRIQSATMTAVGLVDEPSYHAPVEVRARVHGKAAPTRMAMISAAELRSVLGADAALQGRVDSIYAAACARVKRYSINAPVEVRNEAVVLLSAWLYQATAQSRNVFPADQEGRPVNVSRAFLLSGAQGLLSSWRRPRAGACR